MKLNNHKHSFHEFRRVEENNVSILVCLKNYQYQIKKGDNKTEAEIFSQELSENKRLENEKREKEQLRKKLIAAYQRQAKNKKLQAELSLWDSISGDGL